MTRRSTSSPREQIEEAERRLYADRRDRPLRRRLPALLRRAEDRRRHGGQGLRARRAAFAASPPASPISTACMGGLQASDLVILAGRPGMGKTALATNIAFNIAKAYRGRTRADGAHRDGQRRHRRLLLARNVGRATGDPHHRRTVAASPPTRSAAATSPRATSTASPRRSREMQTDPLLHRPDRRHLHRPARPRARAG